MPHRKQTLFSRSRIAEFLSAMGVTATLAVLSLGPLAASEFDINTVNDSGAGSLREALSQAQAGDKLIFQANLDGKTLQNGSPFTLNSAVIFTENVPINLTDNHSYTLIPAITVATSGRTANTTQVPLTFDWGGSGIFTLNGVFSDPTTGTGSLKKSGTGTIVLTNANTFNGGVVLDGGTIRIQNQQSLGNGALTVQPPTGGTAQTTVLDFGQSLKIFNTITLTSSLHVNSPDGTSNELAGIISGGTVTGGGGGGTGGLIITGTGTLTLSGINTFSGGVTVNDNSTINATNSSSLGTGTLTTVGILHLNLSDGITLPTKMALGNNLITSVNSGSATLNAAITDATTTHTFEKLGTGTLILTGTNAYSGTMVVSQGTLQGNSSSLTGNITNNANLVFNQTATGAYTKTIDGAGTITKTGNGTLTFSGISNSPSPFNVTAGVLQVTPGSGSGTGTINSAVNITNSSATLSGTGNVGTVTNNGVVRPGVAGIGSLTINGDFIQNAGGATQIKVKSSGTPANDSLIVNGQARLNGALKVLALDPTYTPGTRYTILTQTGGVTSPFTQASTNISTYGALVSYEPDKVTFELKPTTSIQAAAITSNQRSVGGAMDAIAVGTSQTTFASGQLFSLINTLGISTPDQQRQASDELGGAMFGNMETVGIQLANQFQQQVTNVLVNNGTFLASMPGANPSDVDARGQYPDENTRVWMQGFGVGGNVKNDGNGGGLNYGQGGGLFGIDGGWDETGYVGIAGGSSYAQVNDSFGAKGQITSFQVGGYALKHDDLVYNLCTVNYGYNSYFTNRTVSVPGFQQVLHADYSGNQLGASEETGLKLHFGPVHFQPFVGMQYVYLCQQGLEESGGDAALTANRARANSLRASVGGRILLDPWEGWNGVIWTPYTQARFVGELLDNQRLVNVAFSQQPVLGAFTSQGTKIGYTFGAFGQGLECRINDAWSLLGNVDVLLNDRTTITMGSITSVTRW